MKVVVYLLLLLAALNPCKAQERSFYDPSDILSYKNLNASEVHWTKTVNGIIYEQKLLIKLDEDQFHFIIINSDGTRDSTIRIYDGELKYILDGRDTIFHRRTIMQGEKRMATETFRAYYDAHGPVHEAGELVGYTEKEVYHYEPDKHIQAIATYMDQDSVPEVIVTTRYKGNQPLLKSEVYSSGDSITYRYTYSSGRLLLKTTRLWQEGELQKEYHTRISYHANGMRKKLTDTFQQVEVDYDAAGRPVEAYYTELKKRWMYDYGQVATSKDLQDFVETARIQVANSTEEVITIKVTP